MRAPLLLLSLALGCGGAGEVAAPPPAPEATPPAPKRTETFSTGTRVYTPTTAAELTPTPGSRAVVTPAVLAPSPRIDKALATLRSVVEPHAGDPDNPWAIGHGLLALGPSFQLTNQQPAVDWLFSQYAEELSVADGGPAYVVFPQKRGTQRIEPHTGLMLKVLTEIEVAPDRSVVVQGKPHTVADLYRGVLVSNYLAPSANHASFQSPNDVPWALQGLAAWSPPGGTLEWEAIDGTPMKLGDLSAFSTTVLIAESQDLFQAMEAGADFEKKGQGIFGYTCGGAHLLQGSAYAVARGYGNDLMRKGITGQVPLMFYRLPRELQIYDRLMQRAPQHMALLLVQRLKFLGHFLESMHKLAALGFYTPTAEQHRMLDGAAEQLLLVVEGMEQQAIFAAMDGLRADQEQLYLDIIGDSAHAIHGLELALGRAKVRY